MARLMREMEEVKEEMAVQGKASEEVEEWETLMKSHSGDESASKLFSTRLQKTSSTHVQEGQAVRVPSENH